MIRTKFTTFVARGTLLVCIVLATPSVAQDTNPVRDPQALALLARCGTAMGGASILDTYATGTLTTADPAAPAVPITTQTKGAAERFDIAFSKDNQTYVLNAGSGWAVREGKQARMPYALSAYHRPEHTPALACILDIQNPNMSFAYIGQEKFKNGVVEHVRISLPTAGSSRTRREARVVPWRQKTLPTASIT